MCVYIWPQVVSGASLNTVGTAPSLRNILSRVDDDTPFVIMLTLELPLSCHLAVTWLSRGTTEVRPIHRINIKHIVTA